MEIIKKNSLNYNDLNSKFIKNMIQKLNSNLLQEGITLILFNKTLDCAFDKSTKIKVISLMDNESLYREAIEKNEYEDILYLLNSDENWSNKFNYVFQFIQTSHFIFVDNANEIKILEMETLDYQTTYILNRTTQSFHSNIINNMYKDLNDVQQNEKQIDNEDDFFTAKLEKNKNTNNLHPFLIQLQDQPGNEVNLIEREDILEYPIENDLIKLNTFNGILFPTTSFQNIKFKGIHKKDAILVALTEFIISNSLKIVQTKSITYIGRDELNIYVNDIYGTLFFLNKLLSQYTSDSATSYVQAVVNQLLLNELFKIRDNKQKLNQIISKLHQQHYDNLTIEMLNKGTANELVIAYCFPPYNDTSGNVMAKRIYMAQNKVDIISNNMDRIRNKDFTLNSIANEYIDTKFMLNAPQAFSSYQSIHDFTQQGLEVYDIYKDKYTKLYSRAMFPASHFLAYEIKIQNKSIYWRAEFSDPLLTDVSSNKRYSPIKDDDYIEKIKNVLNPDYVNLLDDNVFNLCEILPLSIADELIFTNEHQLEYIIKRFDDKIKKSIRSRAVISKHPTLPEKFYNQEKSYYQVDEKIINLAYFGNFYDTRGFREIELFCKYLILDGVSNFIIHIFTNLNDKVIKMVQNSAFKEKIILNPYLDYFEFLNLTNIMDILMIYDAHTIGIKEVNPYLPSKLSDYLGSNALTLAFIEKNSILSKQTDEKLFKVDMNSFSKYSKVIGEMSKRINKSLN
ncbi:hypothetical protein ROU88_01750 [Macrococcus capreoli]